VRLPSENAKEQKAAILDRAELVRKLVSNSATFNNFLFFHQTNKKKFLG